MALSLRAWGVTNATRDGSNCQLSGWKSLIAIDWDDLRSLGRARPEYTVFAAGMRSAGSFAIILVVHFAVIVLWQVLVDAFHVPKFILPSPLATLATLTSAKYAWLSNLAVTAAEILGGFCLGAFVGVTLAVMFFWSPLVSFLFRPLFSTPYLLPTLPHVPLFIVWFSYGIFANILIAFSIC